MKRAILGLLTGIGVIIATLVLLEGTASVYLFAHDARNAGPPKTLLRPYTMHDTLLGWINKSAFSSPDEYGKGVALTTTAEGFRNTPAASASTTAAHALACSGDSFTLGYGVSDDHAWCSLLATRIPDLRTLNMGQAAYGIDQAYLWYRRDGGRVAHQVHLFAITDSMFEPALTAKYSGRVKPRLVLEHDTLALRDTPVSDQARRPLRLAYARRVIEDLRFVQLLRQLPVFDDRRRALNDVEAHLPLFGKIFEELAALDRSQHRELVIVFLPTRSDLKPGRLDDRRGRLAEIATKLGVPFIDLTADLRGMRRDSADLAFISHAPRDGAPGVPWHYSNLGNAWVAQALATKLQGIPAVAAALGIAAAPALNPLK